jgi:hypothetical protein
MYHARRKSELSLAAAKYNASMRLALSKLERKKQVQLIHRQRRTKSMESLEFPVQVQSETPRLPPVDKRNGTGMNQRDRLLLSYGFDITKMT